MASILSAKVVRSKGDTPVSYTHLFMSNLMDYLDWRGDLTFREAPFNEVDNLILAQLVYVEFAGIVPAPGEEGTITVKEACELFFAAHDRKEIMERVSMTKTAAFVLEKMAQTERFCNAQLFGYINDISKEEQSQFSVVCVRLDDKSIYVSFSGTDNTIAVSYTHLPSTADKCIMSIFSQFPNCQHGAFRYLHLIVP